MISRNSADGPQILRGANITLYVLRPPSQGEAIYLRKARYLTAKPESAKARHHLERRVGWQESSPQNNFRRIIAAAIPPGEFCNHKINYIPESTSALPLDLVLAILNSKVADWFFRLGSSSGGVSSYQIANLPAPRLTTAPHGQAPWSSLLDSREWEAAAVSMIASFTEHYEMRTDVADGMVQMCQEIQRLEAARALQARTERSHLGHESQPIQEALDRLLNQCFGLTEEDGRYIAQRLEEML